MTSATPPAEHELTRIAIVGGGQMGSGIAEVCIRAGVRTVVVETGRDRAAATTQAIERSLQRAVQRGKLDPADHELALDHLSVTAQFDDARGCDAAIEAVTEDEDAKREVFRRLDELLPDAAWLASNTSSVPIMKLAGATQQPGRVLGLHFFNPVPVLNLVEVVRSIVTTDEALGAATAFAREHLGKTTISSQDRAGFIVNALLVPYIVSAIRMFESGFASREDIDRGMVEGCAHPMGPLQLADLIGLDTTLAICQSLYEEFRDPAAVPPSLLNRMVEAGLLGRKTGRGFYEH